MTRRPSSGRQTERRRLSCVKLGLGITAGLGVRGVGVKEFRALESVDRTTP